MLGWIGGLALLVGLVYFLVIATSRGWIGEEARVAMAAGVSLLLLLGGAWMHERRGRTEAALIAAATGVAGLFAATVVAGPVYGLVPALPATVVAIGVGAVATLLALRWRAQGMAWFGILGALASPMLVGATNDPGGIALMLVAYAAAGAVLVWQRWSALAGTAFFVALLQLASWLLHGTADPSPATVVGALAVFGLVSAIAAAGFEWHARSAELRISAHVLLALNALALAALGAYALGEPAQHVWLAAIAFAHLAAGLIARRSRHVTDELSLAATGLGIVLADVAFASIADGLPLVVGWAASAVGFSVLARAARRRADATVALAGLGGHLLLATATALTGVAPLAAVNGGAPDQQAAVTALAALAAAAWAAARLVAPRLPEWRIALDVVALAALGLLSAVALDGAALTLALAGEAVALATLARSAAGASDPLPFPAALAFLAATAAHGAGLLPPFDALITGADDALATATSAGGLAAAGWIVARAAPDAQLRLGLQAGVAVLVLYVASVLVVTPFQPGTDTTGLPLAELSVRQQGQALLSCFWALAGVAALLAGLLRDSRALRLGALALLAFCVAKVFAFDLAELTSLYRVGSCVALGVLLLAGAFAWQRIRPRALPDLRDVPGALR